MRIYLDMCCFNRPYDDQNQNRIRLETEAKLILQRKIRDGECTLVWSSILDFECSKNPFPERQIAIMQWRTIAGKIILADERVREMASNFVEIGMGNYDALHLASAIYGQANLFVSTDDRLLKKMRSLNNISGMLPGEALAFVEKWYEN